MILQCFFEFFPGHGVATNPGQERHGNALPRPVALRRFPGCTTAHGDLATLKSGKAYGNGALMELEGGFHQQTWWFHGIWQIWCYGSWVISNKPTNWSRGHHLLPSTANSLDNPGWHESGFLQCKWSWLISKRLFFFPLVGPLLYKGSFRNPLHVWGNVPSSMADGSTQYGVLKPLLCDVLDLFIRP